MEFLVSELACKYCESDNIVKDGTNDDEQYYLCRSCNRRFNMKDALVHMKTPVTAVAAAVSMYYKGMSISNIKQELKQIYNIDVSDFAVYNWIERFTKDAVSETNCYRPEVGYVWLADETAIQISGKEYWLLDVIDVKTRFLIASKLSPTRRVEDVQDVLKEAYARTNRIPKVIMTDHLWAYIYGIKLTFGDQSKHLQVKKFTAKPNNNIIERMQGTIKERTKVMRDLKSLNTAQILLDGFLVNYNYFRPHDTLKMTPASKAHVQFPYTNWETMIRRVPDAKTTEPKAISNVPPLPVVKLTVREQKQVDTRLSKRRKLEAKRTGIPYQPKSRGGGRRPRIIMQSIPLLRDYKTNE
jgi:transposase-like protein